MTSNASSAQRLYETIRGLTGVLVVFAGAAGGRSWAASAGLDPAGVDVAALGVAFVTLWAVLGFPIRNRQLQIDAIPRISDLPAIFLYRKQYAARWDRIRRNGRRRFVVGFQARVVLPWAMFVCIAAFALRPLAELIIPIPTEIDGVVLRQESVSYWSVLLRVLAIVLAFGAVGWIIGNREWRRHEDRFVGKVRE